MLVSATTTLASTLTLVETAATGTLKTQIPADGGTPGTSKPKTCAALAMVDSYVLTPMHLPLILVVMVATGMSAWSSTAAGMTPHPSMLRRCAAPARENTTPGTSNS